MSEIDEHKKIDEEWKHKVADDKKRAEPESPQEVELPEPDFRVFVASLATQVFMALGQMENPLTKKKETDLPQSRYLIDILRMLKEKTKGNLTPDETKQLDTLLYNLQLVYVKLSEQK